MTTKKEDPLSSIHFRTPERDAATLRLKIR
jgi:hypothetical protein